MPKQHIIEAGESTESVAWDNGHFWETVWNDGGNADLKQRRQDPNILEEGDVLVVPDRRPKQEPGATDLRHRFRRKGVPSMLRVRLLDQDKPRAGVRWILKFGRKSISGATDAEGWIKCPIMPDVTDGSLTLETGEVYNFEIGTVRPVKSLRGLQNRLRNLGYYGGAIDGEMSSELSAAIEKFQMHYQLPATGQADEATESKLLELHLS